MYSNFTVQKTPPNMTKFTSLKKIHTKIIIVQKKKKNLSRMIRVFSVIQQKNALTCPGLYKLIFQSLYQTSLVAPKLEIDEIVNFRNLRKLFTNKSAAFLWHFRTPFSNRKNETK